MTVPLPVISAIALSEWQQRDDVLVIDCRFDLADPAAGRRDFELGHIAGAVYAHLDEDLSDHSRRGFGRHPLPSADAFSRVLSRWGARPDRPVVACDDAGGALAAARLWWMLRAAGFADVAVLDGGWRAWRDAGLPQASGAEAPPPRAVTVAFDASQCVDFDELERVRLDPAFLLLDARAAERYRGDVEPLDPVAGHVPGARNRTFQDNLDARGHFKPAAALRSEFAQLLDGRDPRNVVHMCGSGVTACHNLLAMEYAGLHGSRLFAPSWSGWVSDPSRPVAKG